MLLTPQEAFLPMMVYCPCIESERLEDVDFEQLED